MADDGIYNDDNNPRNLPRGHFRAYVSHYPTFGAYAALYEDAVNSLFKRVSEGNDTPDMVCFPLLFLMRHTLELGYKYSIFHLCASNGTEFKPTGNGGERHSLDLLHKRLKDEYDLAFSRGVFPNGDEESFQKYYALTEASMKRFEKLDKSSTRSRFPNEDESKAFPMETVDLLELKEEFDKAMILLNTMADVIGSR